MRLSTLSAILLLASSGCTITTYGVRPGTVGVQSATVGVATACGVACDGQIGCRVGVHRLYNGPTGEHFYTTTDGEGTSLGFTVEASNYYYLYSNPAPGLVPLHRCMMAYGKHFYTTAPACEGATPGTEEGTLGYLSPTPLCGAVPLYRSYNPGSHDHFYTTDPGEHERATHGGGWNDEGIMGYVWQSPL